MPTTTFLHWLLLLLPGLTAAAVTTAQEAAATRDILDRIPTAPLADRARVLGGLVRLAFHDAGTYSRLDPARSGRADGCVDLRNRDNAGLQPVVDLLAPVVVRHDGNISRADVWQLAANVAIRATSRDGGAIPLRYGRQDALDATGACRATDDGKLPSAELSHQNTTEVFVDRMGFTQREVTALMGAHTLGRADAADSGYDGVWVRNSASWDNTYYRDILQRPWVRETNANGQHLWRDPGNPETLMLNTDMALAFDIGNDATVNVENCRTGGGGGQRGTRCANTATNAASVRDFADNPQVWLSEFASAWIKMQELGYESGALSLPKGPVINVEFPVVNAAPNNRGPGALGGVGAVAVSVAIVAGIVLAVMVLVCCCWRKKRATAYTLPAKAKEVVVCAPSAPESVAPSSIVVVASPVSVPAGSLAA